MALQPTKQKLKQNVKQVLLEDGLATYKTKKNKTSFSKRDGLSWKSILKSKFWSKSQ